MRRRHHRSSSRSFVTTDSGFYVDPVCEEVIEYWILKIILKLNGHKEFITFDGRIINDSVADFISLLEEGEDEREVGRSELLDRMKSRYAELEDAAYFEHPEILTKNLEKIRRLVGLNEMEANILRFGLYMHYYDIMDTAGQLLGEMTTDRVERAIGILLGYPRDAVKSALSPRSKLGKSGLMMLDRTMSSSLRRKIDMLSSTFVDNMMSTDQDIEEMIKESVRKCAPTKLGVEDFEHLHKDMDLLLPYLKAAIKEKRSGVNVLFYGEPGTGKTELTKAIAEKIGCDIYEVSYADESDEPIHGYARLKAYKVAQSIFEKKSLLFMFDEVEDVFNDDSDSIFDGKKHRSKAWINRMLENNPVPAVWITNDISGMDRAVLRRFDMSFEIPVPPKKKRQQIIQRYVPDYLDEMTLSKIVAEERIAPALVARAAKVVDSLKGNMEDPSGALEHLISNSLQAMGYGRIGKDISAQLPETYNPSCANTSMDLHKLAEGIKEHPHARLCLYGVPGTGKSAFGKWIAEMTDRPFLLKKGSDLISMWVGGTEKNIARAFHEAEEEGAVLVFDEVDSFLQDRRNAQRSWEVTEVNEMLVQMENYNGIFIATTNLIDGLDQASLRRFDLKLEFDYLRPEQAWLLFSEEVVALGFERPATELQRELQRLRKLAPGDFAAVKRQHRFNPISDPMDFMRRLEEECSVKEDAEGKKMGFLA
jgi:SpoVK/Ycf46/Vps4 family AAA+-type ATPase